MRGGKCEVGRACRGVWSGGCVGIGRGYVGFGAGVQPWVVAGLWLGCVYGARGRCATVGCVRVRGIRLSWHFVYKLLTHRRSGI